MPKLKPPLQLQLPRPVVATCPEFSSSRCVWRPLPCPAAELNLDVTLACGQSFRWRRHNNDASSIQEPDAQSATHHWAGVHDNRVWLLRRPDCRQIEFQVFPDCVDAAERLRDYLRLEHSLVDLYSGWSSGDPVFRSISPSFPGVRLLRQCPVDNLFSFICSSNNNIARISQLVEKLCVNFGAIICSVDGRIYHHFPEVSALCAPDVEAKLRSLGFGYRAQYIAVSARRLRDLGGSDWLLGLRQSQQPQAQGDTSRRLAAEFAGVGRKVADCVSLMSLDRLDVVPVDVHVARIARTLYGRGQASPAVKGLSDAAYTGVSNFFATVWRPHSGWAHTVLFSADLARFQHLHQAGAATASGDAQAKAKPKAKVKTMAKSPEPEDNKNCGGSTMRKRAAVSNTNKKKGPKKVK